MKAERRQLPGLLPVLLLVVAVAAALSVVPAADEARIAGKIFGEDGKPVAGLTVRLVPDPGSGGIEIETQANKKGRFAFGMVANGAYAPAIVEDGWVITKVAFTARGPGGEKAGEFEHTLEPGEPTPGFRASPLLRGELNLTVKPGEKPVTDAGMLQKAKDESPILTELNSLFEAGQWAELVAASDPVIAENPDLGGAFYLRAVALWRMKQLPDAVEAMRTAADLVPDQPGIRGTLGSLTVEYARSLAEQGREEEAVAAYDDAVGLLDAQLVETPESRIYLVNRVVALDGAGRVEETKVALRHLMEIDPQNVQPYFRLAEILMNEGNPEEAIAILDHLPQKGTEGATMIYNAAVELWNTGAKDATLMAVDKAIEMDPTLPELYRLKGRCLISVGRNDEGVATLKQYLSMIPEDDPAGAADRALVQALSK